MDVETVSRFLLTHLAERRDPLEVTDHPGQVIKIVASALRTDLESVLADVPAIVADRVAAVECEVVGAVVGGGLQQLPVLVLGQVLSDVHVESRTSVKMLDIVIAMELELVDHREGVVLRVVEVRAVHVVLRRHIVTVLLVPLVVLAGEVLAGNELSVEHRVRSLVLTVGAVDGLEDRVHELVVLRVRADRQAKELGGVGEAVDSNGQVLAPHVDKAGLIHIKHAGLQEVLDDLVEGVLVLVDPLGLLSHSSADVLVQLVLVVVPSLEGFSSLHHNPLLLEEVAPRGILDQPVEVDCHNGLGASRYRGGSHRVLVSGVVVGGVGLVEIGQGVTKAAAAREAVRAVGQVAEEAVTFGPHLGSEVSVLLVGEIIGSVSQQGHGLDGESQDVVVPFLVEPVHEVLLKP